MAILTSSPQTFIDITDQRKLSAYITANLPKVQTEDPNVLPHEYEPDWTTTKLKLTPVVFLDQTEIGLKETGLTISWKRKDGSGAETSLVSGESVSNGILTISKNVLPTSSSGMITYLCHISFYDSETQSTVKITSDLTFTLVKNASNARLAYVTADTYVFKYNTNSTLVGAKQATLSGQVQGVQISKWQYKNSSGNWVDYPTTSDNDNITSDTLIVKPTHAVFVSNVAQIKLVTDDADVFDTISITKLYDGTQGSGGVGGLSVVLGNEAQTIACTKDGLVESAFNIEIPFSAYQGTTQIACSCTVGALPSGITIKTNTAATVSAAGKLILAVAANGTLGGKNVVNGSITLTFAVSDKSVVKNFTWSKSTKGATGEPGAAGKNAVVFSVYAPNGTIVQNQSGSITLATAAYDGGDEITSDATYQWAKYVSGKWTNISGATSATLSVSGSDIVNIQSYRCTMTYSGTTYKDIITVEDKSDPYVSEMLSIGGFTVKNGQGGLVPYVIVRTNQKEVDALKGIISATAPSNPTTGTFWYAIDHSAKTVTLKKYSGSAWKNATEKQSLTYTWYKQDKNGNAVTFNKTGKVIYLSADDIDVLATLQCDVTQ